MTTTPTHEGFELNPAVNSNDVMRRTNKRIDHLQRQSARTGKPWMLIVRGVGNKVEFYDGQPAGKVGE